MTNQRAYLWRSDLAQQIFDSFHSDQERAEFIRMLMMRKMTTAGLENLYQQWTANSLPDEALFEYLVRIDWWTPQFFNSGIWKHPDLYCKTPPKVLY